MWEHGCDFKDYMGNVTWGDCFFWGPLFDFGFKTLSMIRILVKVAEKNIRIFTSPTAETNIEPHPVPSCLIRWVKFQPQLQATMTKDCGLLLS